MPKTKDIARTTLEILEKGFYINPGGAKTDLTKAMNQATRSTKLYKPSDLDTIVASVAPGQEYDTIFEVENETSLDAVRRLAIDPSANIMCLNFASAKNPGGGFLTGAVAQEESIARASGLYPCLLTAKAYYDYHRKLTTCFYSDHMIYSPKVPVFKTEKGDLMAAPVYPSIITSPAVNAGVVKSNEPANAAQIIPVMRSRVEKVLALSLLHKHDTLVLGAWGCGVFRNDPSDIAMLFHEALTGKFARRFKKVVFAVYNNKDVMIEPFRKLFLPGS
jgi:uncharacterized protein (TIGR02452 family)